MITHGIKRLVCSTEVKGNKDRFVLIAIFMAILSIVAINYMDIPPGYKSKPRFQRKRVNNIAINQVSCQNQSIIKQLKSVIKLDIFSTLTNSQYQYDNALQSFDAFYFN